MYNKNNIDKQAEREGTALRKQGIKNANYKRLRLADNRDKHIFNSLFKEK